MKKQNIIAMVSLIASAHCLASDEKYDHFPSLDAPDVATAYCNLQSYNERLIKIVNQSALTTEDMVKVHELTYTLENAVLRLKQTLDDAAETLEEVHQASETLDQKTIKVQGDLYLKSIQALLSRVPCQQSAE